MRIAAEIVLVGCVAVLLFVLGVEGGSVAFGAGVLLVCATSLVVLAELGRDSTVPTERDDRDRQR